MRRKGLTHPTALLALLSACSGYNAVNDVDTDYSPSGSEDQGIDPAAPAEPPVDQAGEPGEVVHNPWVSTDDEPMSTFSVDVDRASYTYGARMLREGILPSPRSVRVEEWINAMSWQDAGPTDDMPFAIHLEAAPSRFADGDDLHLMRIALKAKEIAAPERAPANLVFLVDVSGSMGSSDRLPLVKRLLDMLVGQLRDDDTLGIVTYAGADAVLLRPTPVRDRRAIDAAIAGLSSAGSTAGAAGLRTAYDLADGAFRMGGINRVILCTDGDFNVGLTGQPLIDEIRTRADEGIDLTALGFGTGNLNDFFLEELTNQADGNYVFIGSEADAVRFVEREITGAMQVVARDAKIQVAFNPDTVEAWRLIGYANRILDHQDFDDDSKDAGDIGAGHQVTAYYELDLRDGTGPLADIALRHQPPEGGPSTLQTRALDRGAVAPAFDDASTNFRAGAAVAEFAEILADSPHVGTVDFDAVRAVAVDGWPAQPTPDELSEFVDLVDRAQDLWP